MKTGPVRILFVQHNCDMYGSSRCLLHLLSSLDREKFTPFVVLGEDGPLRQAMEQLKIEIIVHPRMSVITRPVFKSWRLLPFLLNIPVSAWQLRGIIKAKQIDLVHTNVGVVISSGLAAKLAGVPHIWHMREWFQEFGSAWRAYSHYILWLSQRVLCMSGSVAGQFPRSPKVMVVHDGFDAPAFAVPSQPLRDEFRARHKLGDTFVVGCVGRIKLVRKGQEVLIKAAALLKQRRRSAKYLIVGAPYPGNEQHLVEMKRLVAELKLDDDVLFLGELMDPRPAYAAMDVSILPSAQPEPWGLVVIEAMTMGVPVIATNFGGPVEMVPDGKAGFLVPPSDPAALADKIEELMCNPELRDRMAEEAPQHVQRTFSIDKMAREIAGIYNAVLDKVPPQ